MANPIPNIVLNPQFVGTTDSADFQGPSLDPFLTIFTGGGALCNIFASKGFGAKPQMIQSNQTVWSRREERICLNPVWRVGSEGASPNGPRLFKQ